MNRYYKAIDAAAATTSKTPLKSLDGGSAFYNVRRCTEMRGDVVNISLPLSAFESGEVSVPLFDDKGREISAFIEVATVPMTQSRWYYHDERGLMSRVSKQKSLHVKWRFDTVTSIMEAKRWLRERSLPELLTALNVVKALNDEDIILDDEDRRGLMTLLLSSLSLNNFGDLPSEISLFRPICIPLAGWRHLVKRATDGCPYLEISNPTCCWQDFKRYGHLSYTGRIYVNPRREDYVEALLEDEGYNGKYRLVFSTYRSIPVWSIEEHDAPVESFGYPIDPLLSERALNETVNARLEEV